MTYEIPNYTLVSRLGEGAMAEVWLGEHKRNGRRAAIKVLKPSALPDRDFAKQFLREGQVLASFDHANIVRIYDNDQVGDIAYLVMELLSGGTLQERMSRGPISVGEAIGIAVQIASALEAAHRQGVIHRDLKPANVMLRDATTPVLTDFGAARLVDRSTIFGTNGMIVGTPVYMSPEQITGQSLSGSSDLYALGVIFFELLTGARPFPGASFTEISAQHLHAPIPRLPTAIAMLQPILERMLAKRPESRFTTTRAFIDELRRLFIRVEALRQQVGYAATSAAWSSQLRALGFPLTPEQLADVRRAHGQVLGDPGYAPRLESTTVEVPPAHMQSGSTARPARHEHPAIAEERIPVLDGLSIVKRIGRGGIADVYLARQEALGRYVAVKVLRPGGGSEPWTSRERIAHEAKLVGRLKHENICSIHDVNTSNPHPHFIMEYLTGGSLAGRIRDAIRRSETDKVTLLLALAKALQHAHDRSVLHCDVKPHNVMFRDDWNPVLTDFQLGVSMHEAPPDWVGDNIIGTPNYMSPEQIRGEVPDGRSDMYALGILAYELCSGSLPFTGTNPIDTCLAHLHRPVPRLAGVSRKLAAVILRMLEKDRVNRFESMSDVVSALVACVR